jgi:anti-sigma factor (TIGR02949 family)
VSSNTPDCGPECQEALVRLEAYLDGELPHTQLSEIKEHLTACYPCTDRASFEEQIRALVRRECTEVAPSALVGRIRLRLEAGEIAEL